MRITPINFNNYGNYHFSVGKKPDDRTNQTVYTSSGNFYSGLQFTPLCFKAKTASDIATLKKLLAYKIPDLYTGRVMLDPKDVESILQAQVFSSPLKSLVKVMDKYEPSLFPIEKAIYSMVKQDSRVYPNIKLEESLQRRLPDAMSELRTKQAPIFEKLSKLAQYLPAELLQEFNALMETTQKRLYDRDVILPFSAKEFRYKLDRISKDIQSRGVESEIKTMEMLTSVARTIPEKKNVRQVGVGTKNISKRKAAKEKKREKDSTRVIAAKLREMSRILSFSPLVENNEINNLLRNTRLKLYNIPLVEPFRRKAFIHDLQKIIHKCDNEKLVREMEKVATQLPTAKQEVSAFIVKAATNSSEKIGYDLICSSIGTAEHLLPATHGGEDFLSNIGLASSAANNERAHRSMTVQLKKHPEIYENCQKYVDRLIELCNDGTFKKLGIGKWYIINFAEKMYKMSPPEKRMVLDLSKLH